MAIRQVREKEWTKDGRKWIYETRYNNKTYKSKKYLTKKEAINAEREFLNEMDKTNLATRTKNDLFKYLKSALNYGTKWHDFNFISMYNKMTNFDNPNEIPKEMEFYTWDEFNKFISVEEDLK